MENGGDSCNSENEGVSSGPFPSDNSPLFFDCPQQLFGEPHESDFLAELNVKSIENVEARAIQSDFSSNKE